MYFWGVEVFFLELSGGWVGFVDVDCLVVVVVEVGVWEYDDFLVWVVG